MAEQEVEFQVADPLVEIMVNPVRQSPRQPWVVVLDMPRRAMEVLAVAAVLQALSALAVAADILAVVAVGNGMGILNSMLTAK
jgi:hypothetical protein